MASSLPRGRQVIIKTVQSWGNSEALREECQEELGDAITGKLIVPRVVTPNAGGFQKIFPNLELIDMCIEHAALQDDGRNNYTFIAR